MSRRREPNVGFVLGVFLTACRRDASCLFSVVRKAAGLEKSRFLRVFSTKSVASDSALSRARFDRNSAYCLRAAWIAFSSSVYGTSSGSKVRFGNRGEPSHRGGSSDFIRRTITASSCLRSGLVLRANRWLSRSSRSAEKLSG